ncbi:hypothetical protein [Rheinheimera sp. EpRS3]|uniref:hypothetical protein n=1 Tax=Rheinheimera sp. EpRS3 TaxID=1712383 RepID=UPI0007466404|nr:hypothetical protein [Rheinheimera sp. EpRS3]KUM52724.1 hypothetical protein AR688_10645 [Rheinheimera sp. EpRS3]
MDVVLQEVAVKGRTKLCTILLVNCIILGAACVGYKYVPAMIDLDPRYGRLMVLVAMAPVLALFLSISIGVKQPRQFRANTEGITLGSSAVSSDFYYWSDITEFNLCPNSKVLKFRVDSQHLSETLKLKKFSISQQQFDQLQQLAIASLKRR